MDLEVIKNQYPEIKVGTRAEDLTGKVFNNWKVLYRTNNIGQKVAWVCQCQCEKKTIKVVQSRNLKQGLSKDCGCGRLKTISEKADKKIHQRDNNNNIILKRCSRCQQWLSLDNFWKNKCQKDGYCGECKNCQNTAKENRYNIYKKNAKKRGLEFQLSKDEFYLMTSQPCYYCGDIKNYSGIDRVDSSKGYVLNNCVPCCEICNKMKLNYTVDSWILHMKKVIEHMEVKNE